MHEVHSRGVVFSFSRILFLDADVFVFLFRGCILLLISIFIVFLYYKGDVKAIFLYT